MRAAIIGLGPQGKRVANALQQIPGTDLVWVVDQSQEALAWPKLPASTRRSRNPEDCWGKPALDLVCITTNGPSHAELAIAAMESGVQSVMVEKPMACSVADCIRMTDLAARTRTRLSVNQSRRHHSLYRWLRDQIRSGAWGEPRSIFIQRPGIGLGCLGTHYFDLIRFLLDREVVNVTAWVDDCIGPNPRGQEFQDPGGLVILDLGGRVRGIVAQIEDGAGPMSVEIDLTSARIWVDERFNRIEILGRDRSAPAGPDRPATYIQTEAPKHLNANTDATLMAVGVLTELIGDGPMECDARHGVASIEILAASYLSHRRGHVPVPLPLRAREDLELWLPVT